MKVGVLDYGAGNLASVARILERLGATPILLRSPGEMRAMDRIILPGVGNFTSSKRMLDMNSWTTALQEQAVANRKPLLGICLGMQLLAEAGMEGAPDAKGTPGLGLIPGEVHSLKSLGCQFRIPHVGWNQLRAVKAEAPILQSIPDGTDFYFTHSFAFMARAPADVLAMVDYGVAFPAVVGRGNVVGTQFHPEKSSLAGIHLLRNFLRMEPC